MLFLSDLLNSMANTIVFHWIGEGKGADYDIPYFKFPFPPIWIDLAGFITLFTLPNPNKPLESLPGFFQLRKLGTDFVGTQYGMSTLHGAKEDIYTIQQIEPLLDEKQWMKVCIPQAEMILAWVWNVRHGKYIDVRDEKTGKTTTRSHRTRI